ncbi:MAG: hypothetical protein Q9219_002982 [cf. Caloplaca sp. 3 TL-2023]
MPPKSRKRVAQTEIDDQSSAKRSRVPRARTAVETTQEEGSVITNSKEEEIRETGKGKKRPGAKRSAKEIAPSSAATRADESDAVDSLNEKTHEALDSGLRPTLKSGASPNLSRKQNKTRTVKVEEPEKPIVVSEKDTPKKTKKRTPTKPKAIISKEEIDDGEEASTPKKPKRKRKTREEREAEAMPLAARTAGLGMYIGAHVSGAKGVQNAVTNCVHIGGNAFALFLKSQRKWDNPPLQDEHRDGFKANCIEHKMDATRHVLPHGSYLVNLAQEAPEKAKQAYDSFVEDLHRCEALGIKLPGTTNNSPRPAAIARIASALNRALSTTSTVTPLLETMAGSGTVLGSTFADLAAIIALVTDKSRIGICLDTCHLFAAGYDLRSPSAFASVLRDLDDTVGLRYVKALHLNDSKAPLGSRRDLHANIGTGFLGLGAFWNVVNERRFEGLPMVLETPIDGEVSKDDDDGDGGSKKEEEKEEGESDSDSDETGKTKAKAKPKGGGKKRPASKAPKAKTVEDKTIWAREIKLLESLIGMDPDGDEFKKLEQELADRGVEERRKYQEAFDRKMAKEEKVKTKKGIESFFAKGKKGKVKAKENGKKKEDAVVDDGSPLSELSELSDSNAS